jgi:hypothetical protein
MFFEFSEHAKMRLRERDILEEEISEAMFHPISTGKTPNVNFVILSLGRGRIKVIYEKRENLIKIITFYWIK